MSSPRLASWPKMRNELKSFLAPSLVGRIDYRIATYRKAYHNMGHAQILVDGQAAVDFCCYSSEMRECRQPDEFDPVNWDQCQHDFISAAGWYLNRPIEESLAGADIDDPRLLYAGYTSVIRRCLAVMDKRVGRRTLRRLATELVDAPDMVRYFAAIRMQAEGVPLTFDVPATVLRTAGSASS